MSIWMQGFTAQQAGKPITANPYPEKTENWIGWRAGWYFLGTN